MKRLKISLFSAVIVALTFFTYKWYESTKDVGPIQLEKNQLTIRIDKEIASLSKMPQDKFCGDAFREVQYLIDDGFKPDPPLHPFGRLGKTQLQNDQQRNNLSKNLYFAYVAKFEEQAKFVFQRQEWEINNLNFIRSECARLRSSPFLQRGSPIDMKFIQIQAALSKYDEINAFISSCASFKFYSRNLNDNFPMAVVQAKIRRARIYKANNLENLYVKNCARLWQGLSSVPSVLFTAHVRYLDNKIKLFSGKYSRYTSHFEYANDLNSVLRKEIDVLENNPYNLPNSKSEYNRLVSLWSEDNERAYHHSY